VTRLALALVLAGCAANAPKTAAPPPPAAPARASVVSDVTDGDVREAVLSNGLKVLLKEDHAAPVATFVVYYKVGSRNESAGHTGSSHLLEHLQFKGTEAFPGKEAVWGGLSRIGASFNATTYYDRTNYYETVPIEHLPFAIALEADRMRRATFTDADRASEMPVVRNELERGENDPGRLLSQLLWAQAIVAHPYHHPVIGWRSDVESVPTSQLRRYYDAYYQPDNAVAVCVGDFKSADVLAMIVDKFGVHPGGHEFPRVVTEEEPQRGERRFVIRKPGELALVELGWKLPSALHPDVVPLKVLQLVLSGTLELNEFGDPLDAGISHRLYQGLVEKQLATGASFDYTLMIDPSVGSVSARVRPGVTHQAVEDAIRAEIKALRTAPVPEKELRRAKDRARAAFALSQDGTFGQAMALGYFGLIGDWRFVRDFSGRVAKVTAADVQRVASEYFGDDAATVGWFVPTGSAPAGDRAPARPSGAAKLREADDRAEALGVASRALGGAGGDAPAIQRKKLANGLTILVQENPSTSTFALAGSILAGAVHETGDELGLAGLAAEMLECGTKRHTKLELDETLGAVGASLGIGGGFESASLSGLGLEADLGRVLDVLAEELLEPAFPEDELAKARARRIARVQQAEDSTSVRARRALMQALYPKGHPYYSDDPKDVIAAYERADVAKVRRWWQRYYGPDRTVLTVVGKVEAAKVFAMVEERLGAWKPVGGPAVAAPDVPRRGEPGRQVVFVPEKSNVDVVMGEQGSVRRTDPEYYPAMLANHVLGGSNGRLFAKIRNELGLTYGIGSSFVAGKLAGPWTVSFSVNPKAVEPSLEAVRGVLEQWMREGPSERELDDAKGALTGLFQVGLATNAGLAGVLTQYETLGLGAEFVAEHPRRIRAVTRAQVLEAMQRRFDPGVLYTVVGGTVGKP
jgi:zinc protease